MSVWFHLNVINSWTVCNILGAIVYQFKHLFKLDYEIILQIDHTIVWVYSILIVLNVVQ